MLAAAILAFSTGFLSLSQEILWVRIFSFANHSLPQAFASVLMIYLLGIALGAYIGKKLCLHSSNLWEVSGKVLLLAGFFDFVSPWLYAETVVHVFSSITWGAILIFFTALLKAILFPIAHHIGAVSKVSFKGRALSTVYVSNIMGATLGPIVTGFILLSFFTTQQCYALMALFTVITGLYCLFSTSRYLNYAIPSIILAVGLFGFIGIQAPSLLIAKLADYPGNQKRIIETRQGIITLYINKNNAIVYGGNVYDGSTNLNPVNDMNGISRLLVMSALQDNPKNILMIGLSVGTWLKMITSFPNIENIDVVEINPGYLTAIRDYPRQQSALADSRVHLYIDDGRRWLKAHPDKQYDLIIMNTTFNWRMYASNLLSLESISLIKQHMKDNAVLTYNSTSSIDAFKTAHALFPHAYLYKNFIVAANFDWRQKLNSPLAKRKLSSLVLDGKKLFPKDNKEVISKIINYPLVSFEKAEFNRKRRAEIVTDGNLITEYKYGRGL
jgi:spermidine synthase